MDPIIQICVPPILLAIVAFVAAAAIAICMGVQHRAERAEAEAAAETTEGEPAPVAE